MGCLAASTGVIFLSAKLVQLVADGREIFADCRNDLRPCERLDDDRFTGGVTLQCSDRHVAHSFGWMILLRPPGAAAWGISVRTCGLTCEQSVLLGPVHRQIEFAQTRRGELDGLPALQDRFDQLRAQEGEAKQTPDIAPGDALTLADASSSSAFPSAN